MRTAVGPDLDEHAVKRKGREFQAWASEGFDRPAIVASLCFVPVSIAGSETFLALALWFRLLRITRHETTLRLPRFYWFWLIWAAVEIVVWRRSPEPAAGLGEMRHLLLIAAL